ncbi:MAG: hypothetical protein AB201_02000 [Parcubacteria bacterium C7867-006]|nr:MAG: hypothetical protein AB201_02000 [Parcubacteria bacterium C7867-006]
MKLITLNTWGARAGHREFLDYAKQKSSEVDIFCFQEIWNVKDEKSKAVASLLNDSIVGGVVLHNMMEDLYVQISTVLPDFNGFFRPHYGEHYGLAMFIKKDLDLVEEGDVFVYKDRDFEPTGDVGNHARNIQYANINTLDGLVTVINFHGLWNGKGKTDTDDRILQSTNIVNFINKVTNPIVLCGDFNLLPDTESLKMFENTGLVNLVKKFDIKSTRTSLYKKEHRFADYIFTSPGIKVKDFRVLPDEVSDHSPLYIEFE